MSRTQPACCGRHQPNSAPSSKSMNRPMDRPTRKVSERMSRCDPDSAFSRPDSPQNRASTIQASKNTMMIFMAESPGTARTANTCIQSSGKNRGRGFLLLCVLLPFVLALWQWQRGMDKLALEQALATRQAAPPARILPSTGTADLARYRLQGVRAAGLPILLANSLLEGMPGQRVLQPLRLADGSLILADLGWRAANSPLPDLALPAQLPGQWWPWHGRWTLPGARLGTAGEVDAVDMAGLIRRYPGHWHAGVFIAQPPLSGLQPWPLLPPLSAQRHFAYAVQWLLLGLCLLWRWRRSGT